MSNELIPYVIMEAHPDYKRPSIDHSFGVVPKNELDKLMLKQLALFVVDRIELDNMNSINDINEFWENFFIDRFMSNYPWDAMAFIDGKWVSVGPSNEDLFNELLTYKNKENRDDYEDETNDNDNCESV